MHLDCPVWCLGGRSSANTVGSNQELGAGGELSLDGTPGQGLHSLPVVASASEPLVPAVDTAGIDPEEGPAHTWSHLKQNEGRAQAPAAPAQAWSSPRQEGARLGCPRSSAEPCFLMRACFFNETICLAFLTLLSMMGPSVSPVPIPGCLSPPRPPLSPPGSEGGRGSFRLRPSCLFFSSGHIWPPC